MYAFLDAFVFVCFIWKVITEVIIKVRKRDLRSEAGKMKLVICLCAIWPGDKKRHLEEIKEKQEYKTMIFLKYFWHRHAN